MLHRPHGPSWIEVEVVVGSCALRLRIPGVRSLKEKRRILSRLKSHLRGRFNVAVAEVGLQDSWQTSILGVAAVGADPRYVNGLLDRIVDAVERERELELLDVDLVLN